MIYLQVLSHPFFWTAAARFDFLARAGNYTSTAEGAEGAEHALLACGGAEFLANFPRRRWSVHRLLWGAATSRRDYDQRRVCHLLRLIRNVQQHHSEMLGPAQWAVVAASVAGATPAGADAAELPTKEPRRGKPGSSTAAVPTPLAAKYFLSCFEPLLVVVWRTACDQGWMQKQAWSNFSANKRV